MKRVMISLAAGLILMLYQAVLAGDPISPLYEARLEATVAAWERGAQPERVQVEDPNAWPVSASPLSYCAGSVCLQSYCLGSACLSSNCVGSGCVGSICVGSGCAASLCVGSGCAGSACGGSACLGVTVCVKQCGSDGGPPNIVDPDFDTVTFSASRCAEH